MAASFAFHAASLLKCYLLIIYSQERSLGPQHFLNGSPETPGGHSQVIVPLLLLQIDPTPHIVGTASQTSIKIKILGWKKLWQKFWGKINN